MSTPDTTLPGYGTLRPPGERGGKSDPPPRPIAAALTRAAIRAVGALPLSAMQGLGAGAARAMLAFNVRDVRNTKRNIELAFPELTPEQRADLARRSFIEDGRMLTEHAALWTWPQAKVLERITRVHGGEAVRAAMDDGKGVLLAALHLGSIEAQCVHCATHFQLRSQYREPRLRELDPFFRHARERFGAKLLPTGQGSVRLLLRGLKQGELIGIPCDQDAGDGAGIFVPFFGHLANTTTLITRLAQKSEARVFLSYALRRPGGRGYEVHFVPMPAAFYDDDVATSAAAMNALAEQHIRTAPEQWVWSYRRWRVQPAVPGAPQNEDQLLAARRAAPARATAGAEQRS